MAEVPQQVRIGTCAWDKPSWRGFFYPTGLPRRKELTFASNQFRTLEINATFHGAKKPSTFLKWYHETPDDFVFSVKGDQIVTHNHALRNAEKNVAAFLASGVLLLGEKLGPILWQVSEKLPFNPDVVDAFLSTLPHSVAEAQSLVA
ncbi:MAG TPA: DUF72 domain-containing protein, partial [Terrimesophilobacter sp.]|nr:DUF72 domain-containing protein [Terrimesophilobacter sp.]